MSRSAQSIVVALAVALVAPTLAVAQTDPPPPSGGCPPLNLSALHADSEFRYGLSEAELKSDFLDNDDLKERGYRPERLAGVQDGNEVEYATRWVKASGPERTVGHGLTDAQFHASYLSNKDNYRPVDVSGFNTPDGVRFNIIWERNTGGLKWRLYRGKTADEMDDLVTSNKQDGYAPERVEGYRGPGGDLRFVSSWVYAPRCDWQMHNVEDLPDYQEVFDDYAAAGYRQMHVDATSWQSQMWFHAIWWKQPGPSWQVRVDRDWYLYQQRVNNNWCAGFKQTNFYTADNGSAARYGGIWTYNAPITIDDNSPLADQVREEIDCAPGRGGTAIIDLVSGKMILAHADQTFGVSSTIKSAILYALLRKLDAEGTSLQTLLDIPAQLGTNQGNKLTVGNDETIENLARWMIDLSNNWATNRLIQYIGEDEPANEVMDPINAELEAFGLQRTRLNRYFTGTGSPSIHGGGSASDDYAAGFDNVTTPREYATFLQLMHVNPGLLSAPMYDKYWQIMKLNDDFHDDALDDGVSNWSTHVVQYPKAGSNAWGWDKTTNPWTSTADPGDYAHRPQLGSHVQRSEAGRLVFANGQVVVYATFFNDAANLATYQPFDDALDCIQVEVVREYAGNSTGNVLPQCK